MVMATGMDTAYPDVGHGVLTLIENASANRLKESRPSIR
jgi:hypothetical protein